MKIISFTERMHGDRLYLTSFSMVDTDHYVVFSPKMNKGLALKMNPILAEAIAESITYDNVKYEMKIEDA